MYTFDISRWLNRVGNIIENSVKEAALDIMCLCEFAGHKQGLGAARLTSSDFYLFEHMIREKLQARDM